MWGLSLQPSVRPQDIAVIASRLEKASASGKIVNTVSQTISEPEAEDTEPAHTADCNEQAEDAVRPEPPKPLRNTVWMKAAIAAGIIVAAIILRRLF